MEWTNLHASLLSDAFENALGVPDQGAMAYARFLDPVIVRRLAQENKLFTPRGWKTWCVSDRTESPRTITADQAVEIREEKDDPTLLLIDTEKAGAGMDGVYSAASEINEKKLFDIAIKSAIEKIPKENREYAKRAITEARKHRLRFNLSPWTEFDYLVQIADGNRFPGELLHLIGLWPVAESDDANFAEDLQLSSLFMDRLLDHSVAGVMPSQRIDSLNMNHNSDEALNELQKFLQSASVKPLRKALQELSEKEHLWLHSLNVILDTDELKGFVLTPWRSTTGKILKWSGLTETRNPNNPPQLIVNLKAHTQKEASKLMVRWKTVPSKLEANSVQFHVAIVTDMDEEFLSDDVFNSNKEEQKYVFTLDNQTDLTESSIINAQVQISANNYPELKPLKSEEFVIRCGDTDNEVSGGMGQSVRTFSEGFIEWEDPEKVWTHISNINAISVDKKGNIHFRTEDGSKSFRMFQPPLLKSAEEDWLNQTDPVGRWILKVHSTGDWAGSLTYVPFELSTGHRERVINACSQFKELVRANHNVGLVYFDQYKKSEEIAREYILAWSNLFEDENADPLVALANTVEIQSPSGKTIGLIVLPTHPLRIAWHMAYDNLVFYAAFQERLKPNEIRNEFTALDGAMFPAFLPGLRKGENFIFADTLGFHATGMVLDSDMEPKASVSILSRALGAGDKPETAPTVGSKSAAALAEEIKQYLSYHQNSNPIRIHALHPGDGYTIARTLGEVSKSNINEEMEDEQTTPANMPTFLLELYPSKDQDVITGRYIALVREKKRVGSGSIPSEDRWILESISKSGNINIPKLRWARKNGEPKTHAHLSILFDTFESKLDFTNEEKTLPNSPLYAYGLISFFDRRYNATPYSIWRSRIPISWEGQKHPADRSYTDRLLRVQKAVHACTTRAAGETGYPVLTTLISPEKMELLENIHSLCDWVITLDRNAGVEYFDSPRENRNIYDAYIIDCIPEREDLGSLQLITSTSNLAEIRTHMDEAFDVMGIAHTRKNIEFLLDNMKSISGRLTIQMAGSKESHLDILALMFAISNCKFAEGDRTAWISLQDGFIIPLEEISSLIPDLQKKFSSESFPLMRSTLLYVFNSPGKSLTFRFISVKYSGHLQTARDPEAITNIHDHLINIQKRWKEWIREDEDKGISVQAIHRVKLARILRFYADKARRHADNTNGLSQERYQDIVTQINRMIEKGVDYTFGEKGNECVSWIFCPEYMGANPNEGNYFDDMKFYLFGPNIRMGSIAPDLPVTSHKEDFTASPRVIPTPNNSTSSPTSIPQPTLEASEKTMNKPSIKLGFETPNEEELQWLVNIEGNPHLLIAGLPGMGKTTCLLNISKQMVEAGIKPIIFSYHSDIDEKISQLFPSVRFVDFNGLNFNPLRIFDRSHPYAHIDVAAALRDIFVAIFPEIGDVQGEALRKAIKESFQEIGWDDSNIDHDGLKEPRFIRFFEILKENPNRDKGLRTLIGRLEELADYGFFQTSESSTSLWDSENITVIRIHKTQNDNLQKAFASLVFYGLYKDMFRRGLKDRITHSVIFDEAHRAAKLKLIPTMAKECRKYGISLVLASQEAKDFDPSVFSAIANYLVLRLNEADAKALVRNVASSDQERRLIDGIKKMNKYHAFYFTEERKNPAKVRLLAESEF